MRLALNGLLDCLPFRGRLLMPTQAWTLTLISPVTRRRKSPFPQNVLESQTPWRRPAPLPRLLLPLLTSEFFHMASLVYFILFYFILFYFIFTSGFEPGIYVMSFSMNTPFSISLLLPLIAFLVLLCLNCPGSWVRTP